MTGMDKSSGVSDAYHKARHLLALLSGILLTWEFLGLAVSEAAPGLLGIKISIKYVDKIPVVVVILIVYAGFRLGVEWWQCQAGRREETASIADLVVAYVISLFAVAVFIFQRATSFQLADVALLKLALGIGIGLVIALLFILICRAPQKDKNWNHGLINRTSRLLWTILSGSGIGVVVGLVLGLFIDEHSLTVGLPIGAALCGVTGASASGVIRKKLRARLPEAEEDNEKHDNARSVD